MYCHNFQRPLQLFYLSHGDSQTIRHCCQCVSVSCRSRRMSQQVLRRAQIAGRGVDGRAKGVQEVVWPKLGRPGRVVSEALIAPVRGLSVRQAAKQLGVSQATAYRWMFQKTPRDRED